MTPRIAIVFPSNYDHIEQLAKAELRGIQSAGGSANLFRVRETRPSDLMVTVDAPPKSFAPFINPEELVGYDAILFGITTRFGQFPAQWTAFWDITGEVWSSGGFWKKHAGLFVSTGTQIESGEASCIAAMSTLTHHGLVFVPVDRKAVIPHLDSPDNPHGGSRWGAGTYAGADGSRQPSELELQVAEIQGRSFYEYVVNARSKA